MTEDKSFKRRVRARMSKTGESYTAARNHVSQKRDRVRTARTKLDVAEMPTSEAKLVEATGRSWETWFKMLDRWGARDRKHGEVARFLMDEQNVEGWWAQSITVGYERSRGLRLKHQQADGFTVYASKTIAASADAAFEAFVDARRRNRWLTDGKMKIRTKQPGRTARFDWEDGTTRVSVSFDPKGPAKTTVAVGHERLPGPDEAEMAKVAWRQRLLELKDYLEA